MYYVYSDLYSASFLQYFIFLKHTQDRNRHSDYPCSPTMQPTDSCQIIPVTSFELLSFASLSVKLFALFSYTSLVAPVFCSRLIFIITSLYFFLLFDDEMMIALPLIYLLLLKQDHTNYCLKTTYCLAKRFRR